MPIAGAVPAPPATFVQPIQNKVGGFGRFIHIDVPDIKAL